MASTEPPKLKSTDYNDYLARFTQLVGEIEDGQYGQYKGRLVLKMTREQFDAKYLEYLDLGERYGVMLSQSDTIEDTLTVDLKVAEVEMLITSSLFLPFPKHLK